MTIPIRVVRFYESGRLYLAAAVLSLGAVVCVMHLWQADLRAPFNYDGDALLNITIAKIIVDKGWYLHTDALGAPAGLRLEDYPVGDNLACAMMKAASLFTSDPVLLTNLFFLATFPLVAMSALYSLRRFGISPAPALLVSLIYTWLPYHFWRGTVHLYFTAYFLVPPAILVAWWVSSGRLLERRSRLWFSLGLALLLGCNMAYYPFFACFLILVAATIALLRRDKAHAATGAALIATITIVLLLNLTPNVLYSHAHGPSESGKRYSFEAEIGGLKITQLLLPVTGHRLPAFAQLKDRYNATHPLVNENDWVSLGFVGGIGFVVLIGWVLFIRRTALSPAETGRGPSLLPAGFGTLLEHLSVFNLATLLLATIGGFSVLFAVLITPQIRGYNRICVFIAFYSLLTVAIGLEATIHKWVKSRRSRICFLAALVILGLLGLLDQTGADTSHDWRDLKRLFRNDEHYFAQIQKLLPPGSMIFELPYEPFPEYGSTMHQMIEYSEFRPYVHTHGLRWSYGVIKGRPGDIWEKDTASLAPDAMIPTLQRAGFSGIYIDRAGYADHGVELESRFRNLLGAGPLIDPLGRFLFFKFGDYAGPKPSLESILPLPTPTWTGGFYALESLPDQTTSWRWCAADGTLQFLNDSDHPRRIRIDAVLRSGAAPATLQIHGDNLIEESLSIDASGTAFSRVLLLPRGASAVNFHCDAKPLPSNAGDPRSLVWRVDDFLMSNVD